MHQMIEKISGFGLIPVVKIEDAGRAEPLASALLEGGLPVAEITFRTEAAPEAIAILRERFPDMIVGAGTVINVKQCEEALEAGARFIVSPGLDRETVLYCKENNIPVMPGVATPTEVQAALAMGVRHLKFFPAEALGGLKTLQAISAPLSLAEFVPLGGINAGNLREYLSFPRVLACGGTWMVRSDLIENGNFEEITARTRQAIASMLGFEPVQIAAPGAAGMPCGLESLLPFLRRTQGGESGHMVIATCDIRRAVFYLEQRGMTVEAGADAGDLPLPPGARTLKDEIAGYSIHLAEKQQ